MVVAAAPAVTDTIVNVLANTDVLGSGYIHTLTNGNIGITETAGDLRIDLIRSNKGDVSLESATGSIYEVAGIGDDGSTPWVIGNSVGLTADSSRGESGKGRFGAPFLCPVRARRSLPLHRQRLEPDPRLLGGPGLLVPRAGVAGRGHRDRDDPPAGSAVQAQRIPPAAAPESKRDAVRVDHARLLKKARRGNLSLSGFVKMFDGPRSTGDAREPGVREIPRAFHWQYQGGSCMTGAQKRARRRWIWFGLLAVVILGGAGIAFFASGVMAGNHKGPTADDLDVRLGKSEISDIQVTVNEVGTIEPLVKVDVKSTLSGKVTDLLVREGDRVARGQILARVEPDVNQAQTLSEVRSGLNMAEIRARDARKDLETNTRLHEEGLLADQQLKDFRVRFDTAMETLESARTKNLIVEESGIPTDGKFTTSQRANILSPMDGTVIKKNVEIGQTVTSGLSSFNEGTALYTVADVGSMLIKAPATAVAISQRKNSAPKS